MTPYGNFPKLHKVYKMSYFKTVFNFRMIKSDHAKFAETKQEITNAGYTFADVQEAVLDAAGNEVAKKVIGIKRDSLSLELPALTVEEFNAIDPNFVQSALNDLVESVVKKNFVDLYAQVDNNLLTPKFIIDKLASQRASAIPAELYKAFGTFVSASLLASGTKQATIDIITEMVNKKFSDAVLGTYSRFAEQYEALLEKVISTLGGEGVDQATLDSFVPVAEALAKNLESWQAVQSASTELDLGL